MKPELSDASRVCPDARNSAVLLFDALATLLRLARAESGQWLASLPELLILKLYRLPMLLLTWLAFGGFVACVVFEATGKPSAAAGVFLALQLGLTVLLEYRQCMLLARMDFRETRRGIEALKAGLAERVDHERA